jgi:hypothetical protein
MLTGDKYNETVERFFEKFKLEYPELTIDEAREAVDKLNIFTSALVDEFILDPEGRERLKKITSEMEEEEAKQPPKPEIKYSEFKFKEYLIKYSKKLTKQLKADLKPKSTPYDLSRFEKYILNYSDQLPNELVSLYNKLGLDLSKPSLIESNNPCGDVCVIGLVYDFVGLIRTFEYKETNTPIQIALGVVMILTNTDGYTRFLFNNLYKGEPKSYLKLGFFIEQLDDEDIRVEQEYRTSMIRPKRTRRKSIKTKNSKS